MKFFSLAFTLMLVSPHQRAKAQSTDLVSANSDEFAHSKLAEYCRSCHGVRPLRFFYSDNPTEFMDFVCAERSPVSTGTWAQMIVKVLSWPSDQAPDPAKVMEPPSKDWMPRGGRRVQFAQDEVDGQLTRKLIIEYLRARCGL
jgi:hypothetical protein